MFTVPGIRVRVANGARIRPEAEFVLYWMVANRRLQSNFALQHAVDHALVLNRPLVIFEAIRAGYLWASDRLHRFAIEGMTEHARFLAPSHVSYLPYLEPRPGAGRGLLETLASRASVVVSDDFPGFFIPRMQEVVGARISVRLELVDSNGLLPLRATDRVFSAAAQFRRFLHRELLPHAVSPPADDPLETRLPHGNGLGFEEIRERWPEASRESLEQEDALASLPIDHEVRPTGTMGGRSAAVAALRTFVTRRLTRYHETRNQPDEDGVSGLSPYLHWGHVGAHEIFQAVTRREGWTPMRISEGAVGRREGWWGMSPASEGFLDQLVVWRELGFNMAAKRPDYDRYESLPDWARQTLEDHVSDPRRHLYRLEDLEGAETHDEVWNAVQRQLIEEGRIHGYLRMLWGKKILEWTPDPEAALDILIHLNNKYALDGRNPNSYSGIFWTLGRYDRAWPERAVFGKVRSMSSERTRKKVRMERFLQRYSEQRALL